MSGGITPTQEWAKRNAHIRNSYVREAIAEFLGTTLLCFMVVGSGLQSVIHEYESHIVPTLGTIFGLMICIIIFGGISGAHINPAVSLGMAIAGHLGWAKLPLYIFVQLLGGYLGSLLAYGLYRDHLFYAVAGGGDTLSVAEWDMAEGGLRIMSAFSPVSNGTFLSIGLVTEIVLTAILLMAVLACMEKGNMKIPSYLLPYMLALTVGALAMAHGVVSGTLLNPARDLAPRLAAYTLGWDRKACFQNINFKMETQEWWVVGIFGPPIGATIGVLLYCFFVCAQLTGEDEQQQIYESNGAKSENGDWRNTVFIPRTGGQPPAMPVHAHHSGNVPVSNGHGPVGQYNPGYIREDVMRQRQGY